MSTLRVIDENGEQLGVIPTRQAQDIARERGFDLVEVNPTAVPPVARLLDFGQFKYEQSKRDRDARKKQHTATLKEVRLGIKIGSMDLETKAKAAISWLSEGDKVRVTVRFRGREITHPKLGADLIERFGLLVGAVGAVERPPFLEGKNLSVIFLPLGRSRPA